MANRVGNFQCNHFASQQTQGPVGIATRRRPQTSRDDLGLLFPRKKFLDRWVGPLLPVKRFLKSAFHESLTNQLDSLPPTAKCIGDSVIGPCGTTCVSLQQNLCPSHFLAASAEFFYNVPERSPLTFRQSNDILFLHEHLLVLRQIGEKPNAGQSQN